LRLPSIKVNLGYKLGRVGSNHKGRAREEEAEREEKASARRSSGCGEGLGGRSGRGPLAWPHMRMACFSSRQAVLGRSGPVVVRAMKGGREAEGAWKRVEAGGAWADDAHDGRQVELAEAGAVAFTR
jgi:hypothetical protein